MTDASSKAINVVSVEDEIFKGISQEDKKQILILPDNFQATSTEHVFAASSSTVIKLAKQNSVPMRMLGAGPAPAYIEKRSSDWFAPTLFISSLVYTGNPHAVSIALNMISSYLTSMFTGADSPKVSLDIFVESGLTSKTTKIEYRGAIEGLAEVVKVIQSIQNGKDE